MSRNSNNGKDVVFFFGAGAESPLGIPRGGAFTLASLFDSDDKEVTKFLSSFYAQPNDNRYLSRSYVASPLFQKNWYTYHLLLSQTCKRLYQNISGLNKEEIAVCRAYSDFCKKQTTNSDSPEQAAEDSDFKTACDKFYDTFENNKMSEKFSNNLQYYGVLEQDFPVILNPEGMGINRFWRLISYYWRAYFCIAKATWKALGFNGKFTNFLGKGNESFFETAQKLTCFDDESKLKEAIKRNPYYSTVQEEYSESSIITTNYTPFCSGVFANYSNEKKQKKGGNPKVAYLAGKLSLFEDPHSLQIIDINDFKPEELTKRFLFPFLMTQAYIKPIIHPTQIEEYHKARKMLTPNKRLVMIGYSLSPNDGHVVALINDFLLRGGRLLYLRYPGDNGNIPTALRIEDNDELIKRIKDVKWPDDISNEATFIEKKKKEVSKVISENLTGFDN